MHLPSPTTTEIRATDKYAAHSFYRVGTILTVIAATRKSGIASTITPGHPAYLQCRTTLQFGVVQSCLHRARPLPKKRWPDAGPGRTVQLASSTPQLQMDAMQRVAENITTGLAIPHAQVKG